MKNRNRLVKWAGRASASLAAAWLMGACALPVHAATGITLAHPVSPRVAAAAEGTSPSRKASKPKKARKAKQTKPVVQPDRTPSGETVTDRERRLTRECKGRPNAGACLGFAS